MNEILSELYNRQIIIDGIGIEGQQKILNTKVLVVGFGGLGSSVAMMLVRMGIGNITIIDDDDVDVSNIQRQIMYDQDDVGKNKIHCGIEKLKRINHISKITGITGKITENNAEEIIKEHDIIVDCTDNFYTRGIINRACIKKQKTCIYGSVNGFEGTITVCVNGSSPCYECLMGDLKRLKKMDENKGNVGQLGAVVGIISNMQVVELVKIILGIGCVSKGKLILFNLLDMSIQEINYFKRENCFCSNGKRGSK